MTGTNSGEGCPPDGVPVGEKIVFLPLPKNLNINTEGFSFNPSIPVPVEIPADAGIDALKYLTIEMIVAGMIRVICRYADADRADDETAVYYRNFVLACKPNILAEFTAAVTACLQNGSYGMAREAVASLCGLFPGSAEVEELGAMLAGMTGTEDGDYREARRLIKDGNEDAGMKKLRKFLERRPDSWNGWFMLGWTLRRLKRWQDALLCFQKARDTGGRCLDTCNEMAICLMETGAYDAARAELEAALSLDGANTKVISNMAMLALKTGRDDEARSLFRRVLDVDPDDPLAKEFFRV
jgi:tetratricopeptide (TPR) repeat protein